MRKLVVSLDGVVIKEVHVTKDRTTVGRRPFNDIVITDPGVSGEHAALQMLGQADLIVEDLNSTNGTYVNGRAVKRQLLCPNEAVEIGKYKILLLFLADEMAAPTAPALVKGEAQPHGMHAHASRSGASPSGSGHARHAWPGAPTRPAVRMVNGTTAGVT